MNLRRILLRILTLSWALGACSEMDSRPETADKLKPILVQVNAPSASNPSFNPPLWGESVRLDFHFIAPPAFPAISASAMAASPAPLTVPAPLPTVLGAPEVDASHPGLQHIIVRTSVQLPATAALEGLDPAVAAVDFLRFRYSLQVEAEGRVIPISGDFPAYRNAVVAGATANLFSSAIIEPTAGSEVGTKLNVKSEVVNPQNEAIRIGWFVSEGEIKNRRAAETEWELPGPGQYTLVFTVRGKQTRNGTIEFRSVTVP